MLKVYSITLEGVRSAQDRYDRAAKEIARGAIHGDRDDARSGDVVEISERGIQLAAADGEHADLAQSFVSVIEAKNAMEANYRFIREQQAVEKEILDLLA